MNVKPYKAVLIEYLNSGVWLLHVLPYLLERRKIASSGSRKDVVYYLEGSRLGLCMAWMTAGILRIEIERINFHMFDVRTEAGEMAWWKVVFEDSLEVQQYLSEHPEFQKVLRKYHDEPHTTQFLRRRLMVFDNNPFIIIRKLHLFYVMTEKNGFNKEEPVTIFFLASGRPWMNRIRAWAATRHVNAIAVHARRPLSLRKMIAKFRFLRYAVKHIAYQAMTVKYKMKKTSNAGPRFPGIQVRAPKLGVEYYGHLNFNSLKRHSDLFFCQQSKIPPEDVLLYFQHPSLPATDERYQEIIDGGMSAVAINPQAAATPRIPVFHHLDKKMSVQIPVIQGRGREDARIGKDIAQQLADYETLRDYWSDFFTHHNVKVHVSWYKHEAKCFPLFDALQRTGGVGVVYQRSFEQMVTPWTISTTDVFFGFSSQAAHIGSDLHSMIPYYVVTGYLGDHRFALLRGEADAIKARLRSQGARHILAYFDEASENDMRWGLGHQKTQENYRYLLNKVLENSAFGLVLKPKIPGTIRKRLGDVYLLLEEARKTGRCFLFEEGGLVGSYPPAAAALAADVAVHGHLFAATAGIEAALTGTPTLLLDRERCLKTPLYQLGEGRVVFTDWDDLWQTCQEHWKSVNGMPGFGDWSGMIDEMDPFRDGRAAERMGTYLNWLMEGFKANLPRATILADAAERYMKMWGKDKVFPINTSAPTPMYSTVD